MQAPLSGYAKIHVDAGLARSGVGGTTATVCRDAQGAFLGSSALIIHGIRNVVTLETIACRKGMSRADDLLLHDIVIASDSKQVIEDIQKGSCGGHL